LAFLTVFAFTMDPLIGRPIESDSPRVREQIPRRIGLIIALPKNRASAAVDFERMSSPQ